MEINRATGRDPFTGQYPGANIESKEFFRTSEFWLTVVTAMTLMLSALSLENLDARWTATLVTVLIAAYTLGRGIAKAGSAHPFAGSARMIENSREASSQEDEHEEILRRVEARLGVLERGSATGSAPSQRVVL